MKNPVSLDDWRNLPEFEIGVAAEALVLKLGMLAAPVPMLNKEGIGPTYVIKHTRETNPTGVLPTAGIEVAGTPQLYRLPLPLGEWTFEMCTLAQHGIKPLPARLRFHRADHGFLVTPVPQARAQPLQPNTPEWLGAFALLNAAGALHTLAVVSEAGSETVCSICGSAPSSVYRSTDPFFTVESIRLCESCHRRQSGNGTGLVPLS